jgi:hypothetical protein
VVITTTGASGLTALSPVSRPTWSAAVAAHEVGVLLVGERLDGGRVEGPPPLGQRPGHGVLGHHGLAGARRRGDQHVVTQVDGRDGLALEAVEDERRRAVTLRLASSATRRPHDEPADQDRDLVEEHIGTASANRLIGSALGVITAAITKMMTMRSGGTAQLLGLTTRPAAGTRARSGTRSRRRRPTSCTRSASGTSRACTGTPRRRRPPTAGSRAPAGSVKYAMYAPIRNSSGRRERRRPRRSAARSGTAPGR